MWLLGHDAQLSNVGVMGACTPAIMQRANDSSLQASLSWCPVK